jgi:SNF2 family DNA or RNA helicase
MLVKTKPWKHQESALQASIDHTEFALLMEMRTGKSLVIIETALRKYADGLITGMLILAPNGVHDNWVEPTEGEIVTHWPDDVPYTALAWSPKTTNAYTQKLTDLFDPRKQEGKFVILSMNYDSIITNRGFKVALKFLRTYKTLAVADESDLLKSPKSSRTKVAFKLGPLAVFRRILTGTPITQSPLDIWAQFNFLRPGILNPSYPVFRARHSRILPRTHPMIVNLMKKRGLRFPPAIPETDDAGRPVYANLGELEAVIKQHSYRVLRSDCKDMPPKNYLKLAVEMTSHQASVYHQMRTEFMVELAGKEVTAPLVLTQMMYLQQIAGGFLGDQSLFPNGDNPRIALLLSTIERTPGKVIIWARFIPELVAIADALRLAYGTDAVALYYGGTSNDERTLARSRFLNMDDPLRFMVGQPSSGGVGVPMHSADTVFYYSNEFKLRTRLQSEDRAQHMNKETPVEYYDMFAPDTVDVKVITALRNKHDVAREVTGDNWKEWI